MSDAAIGERIPCFESGVQNTRTPASDRRGRNADGGAICLLDGGSSFLLWFSPSRWRCRHRSIRVPADPAHYPGGAGRHDRSARAHFRRQAERGAQAAGHRGQPRERLGRDRGRDHRQGAARRLHAAPRLSPAHGERGAQSESALPPGERLHADHSAHRRRLCPLGESILAAAHAAGVPRVDQALPRRRSTTARPGSEPAAISPASSTSR